MPLYKPLQRLRSSLIRKFGRKRTNSTLDAHNGNVDTHPIPDELRLDKPLPIEPGKEWETVRTTRLQDSTTKSLPEPPARVSESNPVERDFLQEIDGIHDFEPQSTSQGLLQNPAILLGGLATVLTIGAVAWSQRENINKAATSAARTVRENPRAIAATTAVGIGSLAYEAYQNHERSNRVLEEPHRWS